MLDSGTPDGERLSAMGLMRNFLEAAEADAHDLIERLTTNEDMNKIYSTGLEHGAKQVEQKPTAPPVAPASRPGMFTEFDDVGYGLNGFSWVEIAQHCADHPEKLNDWEREHMPDIAANVTSYGGPTWKQANVLARVFRYRFQARI